MTDLKDVSQLGESLSLRLLAVNWDVAGFDQTGVVKAFVLEMGGFLSPGGVSCCSETARTQRGIVSLNPSALPAVTHTPASKPAYHTPQRLQTCYLSPLVTLE